MSGAERAQSNAGATKGGPRPNAQSNDPNDCDDPGAQSIALRIGSRPALRRASVWTARASAPLIPLKILCGNKRFYAGIAVYFGFSHSSLGLSHCAGRASPVNHIARYFSGQPTPTTIRFNCQRTTRPIPVETARWAVSSRATAQPPHPSIHPRPCQKITTHFLSWKI